jgi:hypothetical protein
MSTASPPVLRTSRTRWGLLAVLTTLAYVCLASAAVLFGALYDQVVVTTRHEQASVAFGEPMPWLVQDQTVYDPPVPDTVGVSSPWENPTSVEALPLLADLAIAGTPLAAAYLIFLMVRRRPS